MKQRFAFTMIELIFVIVVMGILAKFGVEFLAQAYENFIKTETHNRLQAQAESAVEIIAARLQYRIKASTIGRKSSDNSFVGIQDANDTHNILEWVGYDSDGFRGKTEPLWSGIINLDDSNASALKSPETNTTAIDALVQTLSHSSGTTINDVALYFIGADSNVKTDYGWDGNLTKINLQQGAIHPIRQSTNAGEEDIFIPFNQSTGVDNNFSGVDVYEHYQLAWSAYAVGITDYNTTSNTGTLKMWYDYQPWQGESYSNKTPVTIMESVSTFRFKAVGSVLKIQVCVNSDLIEDYSVCKEKTVF